MIGFGWWRLWEKGRTKSFVVVVVVVDCDDDG